MQRSFHSFIKNRKECKDHSVLLKRTGKNAKIVLFFYKKRKRTQRSFHSFEKIGCPTLYFIHPCISTISHHLWVLPVLGIWLFWNKKEWITLFKRANCTFSWLGTVFFSILNVLFFSILLKKATFFSLLFLSFWRLMKPRRTMHSFTFFS